MISDPTKYVSSYNSIKVGMSMSIWDANTWIAFPIIAVVCCLVAAFAWGKG